MSEFKVGDRVVDVNGNEGSIVRMLYNDNLCCLTIDYNNKELTRGFDLVSFIPSFMVKKAPSQFKKGEKVLVEAVIVHENPDKDGEICLKIKDVNKYVGSLFFVLPTEIRKLESE